MGILAWLRRRLGAGVDVDEGLPVPHTEPSAASAAATTFASDLMAQMPERKQSVVGTLSVFDLLTLIRPLAAGETEAELAQCVGAATPETTNARRRRYETGDASIVRAASAIFVPPSVELPGDTPGGLTVERLRAGACAAEQVNAWVEAATEGRIAEVLSAETLDGLSQLLMVDALYFRGAWQTPFPPERTALAPFQAPSGTIEIETMEVEAFIPVAVDGAGGLLVSLPYRGEGFALDVVVGLAPGDVRGWQARRAQARRRLVRLRLPRFSVAPETADLRPVLHGLGVRSLFDAERACLPGLGAGPLWIERLLHRARIDVTEEGTEAAAATTGLAQLSVEPDALPVHIDRPFAFFLHDLRDPTVLFAGGVDDPRRS